MRISIRKLFSTSTTKLSENKCEKKLARVLRDALEEDNDTMHLNSISASQSQVNVEYVNLSLNFGISTDRSKNQEVVPYLGQDKNLNMLLKMVPSSMMEFKYYQTKSEAVMIQNVMRFIVGFKTNMIISKDDISDARAFEEHTMVIESEFTNLGTLFKILRKVPMASFLPKSDEEINLKVADFDDYLGGNKLV